MSASARPLDRIDRSILAVLAQEGRISNADLAERVGLSASPCWQRVKRLEGEGIIRGYAAVIDEAKLGLSETVLVEVMLERHDDEMLDRFGAALAAFPEVAEAYLTTGEYDYFIKVMVDGTSGYERFLRDKLYRIPGIRHTRSYFALRCLKRVVSPAAEALARPPA